MLQAGSKDSLPRCFEPDLLDFPDDPPEPAVSVVNVDIFRDGAADEPLLTVGIDATDARCRVGDGVGAGLFCCPVDDARRLAGGFMMGWACFGGSTAVLLMDS